MKFQVGQKVVVIKAPFDTFFSVGAKGIVVTSTMYGASVVHFTEGKFSSSNKACWYVADEQLEAIDNVEISK